ncbi:hypothetical protein ACIPZF_13965 [Pseudomonas sp. NPDC089752]|uniref:hypothetical protein n=1 Tax=Pseudomonas sp. NPDC089752 TaxID=3364472 RepID=UPI003818AC4D
MSNSANASQWLRRFRVDITSNSNRVFANGRQQVEVTITIEPRQGQTISEQSLASMQLILIDDDGKIHDLKGDLKAHAERDPRFVYHAASGAVPSPLLDASTNAVRRRFYVTSTLPGGTLSTIHAGIWKDETTHFETNEGPFQSSVVLESISPRRHPDSAFQLSMEPRVEYQIESVNNHDDEFKVDVGYFGFKDPNFTIVQSIAHATASGEVFYKRRNWDHALFSFEGVNDYSQHYDVSVYAVEHHFHHEFPEARKTFLPRRHHMAIFCSHRRFYSMYFNEIEVHESLWTLIDQDGNAHEVEFFTTDNDRVVDFRVN